MGVIQVFMGFGNGKENFTWLTHPVIHSQYSSYTGIWHACKRSQWLCVCVHPTRFAIDWRPAQRLLVFLKTASVVCHLEVGEGYPSDGRVKLVTVRKDNHDLDITTLQVRAPVSLGVELCWRTRRHACLCVCLECFCCHSPTQKPNLLKPSLWMSVLTCLETSVM